MLWHTAFICHDYNRLVCRLHINLKKVKFELRMRKKKAFQYRYYILALENITFSCLGSSSRVSTNGIAANYVLFSFSMTTQDLYAMGLWSNHFYHLQECFKDIWCICKFKRRSFSCECFDHFDPIFRYTNTNTIIYGFVEANMAFQFFSACSRLWSLFIFKRNVCVYRNLRPEKDPTKEMQAVSH